MGRRIIDGNKGMDFSQGNKKVKVFIDGIEHEIKNSFKAKTYNKCKEIIESEQNYKKAFEEIKKDVFEKEIIENKVTIEELEKFKENDDQKIIYILLKKERELEIYESMEEKDIYEKYFKTFDRYMNEQIKNFQESMLKFCEKMSNVAANSLNSISDLIKNSLNRFTALLEENSKRNKENLKKFANYGWTSFGNMPIDLFFNEVNSRDEADKLCLDHIDKETLNEILKEVKETSTKNNYIEESVILFEKEYYRSSAMLIIAYMDRVISENIDLKDKSKYSKKIGKSGIDKMIKAIEKENSKSYFSIEMLYNLLIFLEKVFENGNNFEHKIDYVNRNYLMHGWLDDNITKIDCIKLYIALLNLNNNIGKIKIIFEKYKEELKD